MWCFETEIAIAITITKKSVIDCNRLRLPITITPCLLVRDLDVLSERFSIKGRGMSIFMAPILNLGDVETQNNIFNFFEIHYRGESVLSKCAKICTVMVSSACGIVSQGTLQIMKHNIFYSENKFAKRDANCQNDLATCFYRLP